MDDKNKDLEKDINTPDDENIPDEPFDLTRKPDPYMERLANGARIKTIPDISEYARKTRAEEQSQQ